MLGFGALAHHHSPKSEVKVLHHARSQAVKAGVPAFPSRLLGRFTKPLWRLSLFTRVEDRARSIVAAKANESSPRDSLSRAPSLNAARTAKLPHTHALSLPAIANTMIVAAPLRRRRDRRALTSRHSSWAVLCHSPAHTVLTRSTRDFTLAHNAGPRSTGSRRSRRRSTPAPSSSPPSGGSTRTSSTSRSRTTTVYWRS